MFSICTLCKCFRVKHQEKTLQL